MRWNCLWSEKEHCYSTHGDYALLGPYASDEVPAGTSLYICNLAKKSSMKINVPEELESNIQICLAVNEKKLLLTDGKECYLVDVSGL